MKRSPLTLTLVIGGAFLLIVAVVFLTRTDEPPKQITMGEINEVRPTADNVDPGFHTRLMALRAEVEASPRDTSKLLALARMNQDGHQLEEAAEVYERFLAMAPEHRQARLDLALSYSELGRWEEAQLAMEELLIHYPNDPTALYNLGAIHANNGDYDEARRQWARVQTQTKDIQLASQATASLAQLDAIGSAPQGQVGASQPTAAPAALPSGNPQIPPANYEPVIAGQ